MLKKIIPVLFLIVLLTGCIRTPAKISWVDFIKFNNISYDRNYYTDSISDKLIGTEIGEIKFNVAENIHYTNYKTKNGDAAFLKKGVKLYKLKDYNTDFLIAAKVDNEYRLYEADTNPNAKSGEDLLDIKGKVKYIGINSETDGKTELAAITDPNKVDKLVNMITESKVIQTAGDGDGERYFIAFHLKDGINAARCLFIKYGELSRGIVLPKEFGIEVKNAISKK